MRTSHALLTTLVLCMSVSVDTMTPADAAQRTACQILPVATVRSILGSTVVTPTDGATATVTGGTTAYQCYYVGPHGASLMIWYNHSPADAAAQSSGLVARLTGGGRMAGRGGSALAGSKGNVAFMVAVRATADKGKLPALLAAAMRGL